jgi:hypothetical protein
MVTINIVSTLKAAAREEYYKNPTLSSPGFARLGPITCGYHPCRNSFHFRLGGSRIALSDLWKWLREGGWR